MIGCVSNASPLDPTGIPFPGPIVAPAPVAKVSPDIATDSNVNAVEKIFLEKLDVLKNKRKAIPAELRLDVFKSLLKDEPEKPELVPSKIVRAFFDFDLSFVKQSLQGWKIKTVQAQKALKNIQDFFAPRCISEEMSFKEHAYYCFCLSAFMSGINPEDLDREFDRELHTMVKGVIHPKQDKWNKWTLKNVVEDQSYAKFIFHVSGSGLARIQLLNYMASFRLEERSKFCAVRLVAVPCAEEVGFDGIEDCGSIKVLIHDFIHAGFMKYAYETDPERYWEGLEKIGLMLEYIRQDLADGSQLRNQVEAAFFMWSHELTTSVFVDGWPRSLPEPKWYYGGLYTSGPQILLRITSKINFIPELFAKEIENEEKLLQSLGMEIKGLEDDKMSEHEKVKEIMSLLDPGYKYLADHFKDFYGHRHRISVLFNRIVRHNTSCVVS